MDIQNWIKENRLDVTQTEDDVFSLKDFGKFLLVREKEGLISDPNLNFLLSESEIEKLENDGDLNYLLFDFGGIFYYTELNREKFLEERVVPLKFNDFKYLGKAVQNLKYKFSHLGVHGEYELLNGSGLSEDWAKKAKFYDHEALGICDKNTLAGTLAHQLACEKLGIKSILGETIDVRYGSTENGDPIIHELIVFAINSKGWKNLLKINKSINIDNKEEGREGFVDHEDLLNWGKGLALILSRNSIVNVDKSKAKEYIKLYKDTFPEVFYQLDSVDIFDERSYVEYASGLKRFLTEWSDLVKPILLSDSYYLDPEYFTSRIYLNEIKRVRGAFSHDQFYKNLDDHIASFDRIYDLSDDFLQLFEDSINNVNKLVKKVDFSIEIGRHKLPAFEYDGDNIELFFSLLEKGLKKKVRGKSKNFQDYLERVNEEASVIVEAGFVDYFLILWDIIKWAKESNHLVGNARGSVAGSLVAYLLDITTVDPIQYDLLFERFLNKTRVSGERAKSADSLPDVDVDFGGATRDQVKLYLEQKYGKDYVVSVGSYTRLKLKGAIKGFGRVDGLNFTSVNFVTKRIEDRLKYEWGDLFQDASKNKILKGFIQSHLPMVNSMKPVLNSAQTSSIHASAVVIVPKFDHDGIPMTVFDWMPVRKIRQGEDWIFISEWEGKYMERAGFLKEDILGVTQLDKFKFIISLVEKLRKKKIILEDIPVDDPNVYKIFQGGFNEDVFQFGTSGLMRYSRQVKPDNIEDLIAMNALFRPGPMGSNAHNDFVDFKNGKKKPEFDYGLKEVTKNTMGLYVYQEQIMKAVHVLGGLSLSEADEIRTVMKKFDKVKMEAFRGKFLDGAVKNGCKPKAAELIWDKLEKFSGYGFNRSHAAAYSIMAYWCQHLKCYYKEEFYTAALNFSKSENNTTNILDEIESRKTGLEVSLPDINTSQLDFVCDVKEERIYWSLEKIKGIGYATVKSIISNRNEGGDFESVVEFIKRMKGSGVGAGAAEILIKAGAFDNTYALDIPSSRLAIMEELFRFSNNKKKLEEYDDPKWDKSHIWTLEQKKLTGHGKIDFKALLRDLGLKEESRLFHTGNEFNKAEDWKVVCVAGRLMYVDVMNTRKGKSGQLTIECNNKIILVRIWADVWEELEKSIMSLIKKKSALISVIGKVKYDDWSERKVLFSDSNLTEVQEL